MKRLITLVSILVMANSNAFFGRNSRTIINYDNDTNRTTCELMLDRTIKTVERQLNIQLFKLGEAKGRIDLYDALLREIDNDNIPNAIQRGTINKFLSGKQVFEDQKEDALTEAKIIEARLNSLKDGVFETCFLRQQSNKGVESPMFLNINPLDIF